MQHNPSGLSASQALTDTETYLYALRNRGSRYGIERMRQFCAQLGQPQLSYPLIHVAGTNGKGSVCAMIEAIFRAAGYRCGLFTSPHLRYLGERVQIDRQPIDAQTLCRIVAQLRPLAASLAAVESEDHPSFFEMITALALVYFQQQSVDVAVVETGLGGRLDSTNVVDPLVSVITTVSLDHTEILGDDLAAIAQEKAGIIKAGHPVVIGRLATEAEQVIRRVAADRGCRVHSVEERFGSDIQHWPASRLQGEYQRVNTGLAVLAAEIAAAESATLQLSQEAISHGLATVKWAGRWDERTSADGRRIIFESAHNPEGARWLARELQNWRGDLVVVVGALGTTRAGALLEAIATKAETIYLVVPDQPRACSFEQLRSLLPAGHRCQVIDAEVAKLFPGKGQCTIAGSAPVLVTGSIYLIGEILNRFEGDFPATDNWQDVLP